MNQRKNSTADMRRYAVTDSAIKVFARSGYATSPVSRVAEHAGISPAYVMKLFPRKVELFVAAIDTCYDRIVETLKAAVVEAESSDPAQILELMAMRYAELIVDRDLLLLQVQALAAAQIPEVQNAVQQGIDRITSLLTSRANADTAQIQAFLARGQLCHLLTAIGAFDSGSPWATTLTRGFRHYPEFGMDF